MQKWKQKENKDAKDFGGRRHKGSGNYWAKPGDVSNEDFLIDSKQTDKASYSISEKTWDHLYEQALFSHRLPMLSIQINKLELVVLSKDDFMKLIAKKS